jgi:hypothetical protein
VRAAIGLLGLIVYKAAERWLRDKPLANGEAEWRR